MKLQILWPLAFLAVLPVIVLLYMMKQKAKEQKVSSLYLWREAYQNLRSDTPWEKLRHNLLMYLQLLAMALLILAMTAPYLTGRQEKHSYPIIVIDRSASMSMEYEEGRTRLEVAKEEAIRYIRSLDMDARITVVAADDAGTICLSASQSIAAAEQAVRAIEPTQLAGGVAAGQEVYTSLAALYEDYFIRAYTDTPVDFGDLKGEWVDVATEVPNASVDLVSHTGEEPLMVMVKVSNHSSGQGYHGDLSLYLEEELLEVHTIDIEARSSELFYFEISSIPAAYQERWQEGLLLTVRLSGKDALEADNEAYDVLQKSKEGKALLVTEQNVFLEQALRANERLTVYKTNTTEALSGYDLYLYDGIFPETLPEDGAIWLLNVPAGQYDWLQAEEAEKEETEKQQGGYLTFQDSIAVSYLTGFQIGYTDWQSYRLPEWGECFLADGSGACVGFFGKFQQPVAVLGLDLHKGDFPLQSQFPIFISQLLEELLGLQEKREIPTGFPVSESGVLPSARAAGGTSDTGEENSTGTVDPEHAALVAGNRARQESGYPLRNFCLLLVLGLLALISWIFLWRQIQEARAFQRKSHKWDVRQITIPVLRLLSVLLIFLAMADLTVSGKGRGVTTVYLLDVSDSCEGDQEKGEAFIREAMQEAAAQSNRRGISGIGKKQEKSAVVAFGGDARVEQFVSEEILFQQSGTSPIQTATNLERAVQTGLALIPEEDAGRLVLLTDGGETEGDITNLIRGVTERQVSVKVVALSGKDAPENYISQLEVPPDVQIGDSFLITVQVESNCRANAFITLYEGNVNGGETQKAIREVELFPGTNQFVFTDTRTEEGLVTYRAVLESENDSRTVNNQYSAFTRAETPSRFLLLEKESGESAALQQVFQAAGVWAEVRLAKDAPKNLMDLNAYRAVILLDVPVSDLQEEFLSNLESYVRDYGGGLVTIGGSKSYALGGYRDTVLEDLLPVEMDLKNDIEVPSLSMVYVIDKSGSMGSGISTGDTYDKLAVAKSAAAEAAKNLREIDRVGVLAFDDRYEWMLHMAQADDQENIREAIGQIKSGGGTSIYPALAAAVQELEKEDTKLKHVILLTDGQDSYGYYSALTKRMEEKNITLSTVAVGDDADTKLLNRLASEGQGRYYQAENLSELPEIFAKEVLLSMGEYLVNREFVPSVSYRGELLSGVWENGMYPLLGYTAATAKPTATVYLQSDSGEPILSSIQAGLGRTVAWQSDAVGGWNVYYEGTKEYAALWRNITDWVQTDLGDENGTLSVERNGTGSRVVYQTEEFSAETEVSILCTDREGNQTSLELEATAPGVYETTVELEENQAYSLFLTKREGGEVVSGQMSGIAMQYSQEYRFADRAGLDRFLEATAGQEIQKPSEIYENASKEIAAAGRKQQSLSLLFLCFAAVAFFADIVLRRFDIHPFCAITRALKKNSNQKKKHSVSKKPESSHKFGEAKATKKAEKALVSPKSQPGKQEKEEILLDTSALLKRKDERKRR